MLQTRNDTSPAKHTRFVRWCFLAGLFGLVVTLPWAPESLAQADYRLAISDVVEFDFLHDESEPRRFVIANDGAVQLPLIGGVEIANLKLSEAHAAIEAAYVDAGILVDPMISISIAQYRPIFLLGDVENPGSYPFQPLMTVEQAIGLAGGPATLLGSEEDRILMRESLRTQIETISADIARQAIWFGRIAAQLDHRETIADSDLPAIDTAVYDEDFIAELKATEERVIAVDAGAFSNEVRALESAIDEAKRGVALLDELVANQETSIAYHEKEVERSLELQERGITPKAEVSRREQALNAARSSLLQIYGEVSRARRGLGEYERQLVRLKAERERDLLFEKQERQLALSKLMSEYRSTVDRLALLTSWSEADAETAGNAIITVTIRRIIDGALTSIPADPAMSLAPGDTIDVSVKALNDSRHTPRIAGRT